MHNRLISYISSFTFAAAALCLSQAQGETTFYHSEGSKCGNQVMGYLKTAQSVSRYLAYRDVPKFISKYVQGPKALDHGTGTGFSTQFLLNLGLEVTGVDVSQDMLNQASMNCPNTPFLLIENGTIPIGPENCDLVFSSLVLFELGSKEEVLAYLKEAERVMKQDGTFIAVTGSQDMYSEKDWLIFNVDYPENKNLMSGDLAKVYLRDADIEFTDFYWTESDYRGFFEEAGLDLVEIHYPMGQENEPYAWKDEKSCSPFVVFVAKKLQ